MKKEFTATMYIFHEGKVVLLFHPKIKKWLPPGGHVEENETPEEAAIREVLEETGLIVEIIPDENLWINRWNAKSFYRPYLCLLEEIPGILGHPPHQHVDFLYLGKIQENSFFNQMDSRYRFFSEEEIASMEGDKEIFEETKETLHHLFKKFTKEASV